MLNDSATLIIIYLFFPPIIRGPEIWMNIQLAKLPHYKFEHVLLTPTLCITPFLYESVVARALLSNCVVRIELGRFCTARLHLNVLLDKQQLTDAV